MTGVVYLFVFIHYGLTLGLIAALAFISVLIPIVFIDLKHQIIPDKLNLVGAILGLLILSFNDVSLFSSVLGSVAGGLIMLLIAIVSRGGMGGGDVKMMAMMGLFLGLKLTFLALFFSFVIGGLGSLLLILFGIKKRKDYIPFGPFLAIGGFAAYVFGIEILAWYFKTFMT
jgi:leader peptidase (prepilin peptidase)/N-methyltransferase